VNNLIKRWIAHELRQDCRTVDVFPVNLGNSPVEFLVNLSPFVVQDGPDDIADTIENLR
jgi:hypothetical protein